MATADAIQVVFGNNLRAARLNAGMTQETLADRAGLEKSFIGMLERGEKSPSLETISKLANVLAVPVDSLLAHVDADDSHLPRIVAAVRILESRGNQAIVEKIADLLEQLGKTG